MRVSRIVLAACGAAMVLVVTGLGLPDARAAGSARVQLSPASDYVQSGSTIDLYVEVQNLIVEPGGDGQGLGTYEFRLTYDPAVVEFVGVANLSFLGSTGRLVSCGDQSDAATATIDYRCNTNGLPPPGGTSPAGPTGNGQLTQIRFRGVAAGQSALHFTKLDLGDEDGEDVTISDYGEATIRVGTSATDGSGGGSAATPTKVPRALTPTVPPNAGRTPIPTLGNDVYDPNCAGQGACNLGETGSDGTASQGATGTIAGTTGGGAAGAPAGGGSTAGTGAPVAGSGPPPGGERWPAAALRAFVIVGGLLILAGLFARRNREA